MLVSGTHVLPRKGLNSALEFSYAKNLRLYAQLFEQGFVKDNGLTEALKREFACWVYHQFVCQSSYVVSFLCVGSTVGYNELSSLLKGL